jgi:hypothetical protein
MYIFGHVLGFYHVETFLELKLSCNPGLKVEEDGEIIEDPARAEDVKKQQLAEEGNVDPAKGTLADGKPAMLRQSGWSRRDVNQRAVKRVNVESCLVVEGVSVGSTRNSFVLL